MIPIFDSEVYWGKCVNSIVNQTYRKIRILLVDDSSSDINITGLSRYNVGENCSNK